MTDTFVGRHAAETADLYVGALPFALQPRRRGFRIIVALLRALHESRRRQAERDIRRHQYLLDRYARPPQREQFADPASSHWVVSGLVRQPSTMT